MSSRFADKSKVSKPFASTKAARVLVQSKRSFAQRKAMQAIARREAAKVFAASVEKKYVDTVLTTLTGVTYAGTIGLFAMPAAGADVNSRVGDKIRVTGIDFKYTVVGYDTTNLLRVILFKWNNDDGSYAPTVANILGSADLSTQGAPLARLNWDNQQAKDFEILYDKCHALSFNNTTAAPGSAVEVAQVKLWGKGLGSTPTIELNNGFTTGKGRYGVLYVSDSALAGHPKIAYTARIEFSDA